MNWFEPSLGEPGYGTGQLRGGGRGLRHGAEELRVPGNSLPCGAARRERHRRRRGHHQVVDGPRAEQRTHCHHLRSHGAGRFDARLDLFLAHQGELSVIASAWLDARHSHAAHTLVDDLRRGQHHFPSFPRDTVPGQKWIGE